MPVLSFTTPAVLEGHFQVGLQLPFIFVISRRKLPFLWRKLIVQLAAPQQTQLESCFTLGVVLTPKGVAASICFPFFSEFSGFTPFLERLKPRSACEGSSCFLPL